MSSRLLSWVAAGTMLLASAILMPATTALAGTSASQVPRTAGPNCSDTELACVYISGSGNHINYMKGWARNQTIFELTLHVELIGPHGKIKDCSAFTIKTDQNSPNCVWSPNANETPGSYCSETWHWNSFGWQVYGEACITVNS